MKLQYKYKKNKVSLSQMWRIVTLSHHHGHFHSAPHRQEPLWGQDGASFWSAKTMRHTADTWELTRDVSHRCLFLFSTSSSTIELLKILVTHPPVQYQSRCEKEVRERKKERWERRGEGEQEEKSSSHLEGFQQAHTVTRVIRRNMPPVDRMI